MCQSLDASGVLGRSRNNLSDNLVGIVFMFIASLKTDIVRCDSESGCVCQQDMSRMGHPGNWLGIHAPRRQLAVAHSSRWTAQSCTPLNFNTVTLFFFSPLRSIQSQADI